MTTMSKAKAIMAATDAILATCDLAVAPNRSHQLERLALHAVIIGVDQDNKLQ